MGVIETNTISKLLYAFTLKLTENYIQLTEEKVTIEQYTRLLDL